MENNRPKIASLSEKELAQLLVESFFKVGRDLKLSLSETKIFLNEVYDKQGWMYIDTFSEAFSRYAAGELPLTDKMHTHASPMFVSRLMKLYFKKCTENKFIANSVKNNSQVLTPEGKYKRFIQFILDYKCLPENPDWVTLLEYLAGLKKLAFPEGWNALAYPAQWRYSVNAVSEWAYRHFTVNNILSFKDKSDTGHLKGIGTKLGETIWNEK